METVGDNSGAFFADKDDVAVDQPSSGFSIDAFEPHNGKCDASIKMSKAIFDVQKLNKKLPRRQWTQLRVHHYSFLRLARHIA